MTPAAAPAGPALSASPPSPPDTQRIGGNPFVHQRKIYPNKHLLPHDPDDVPGVTVAAGEEAEGQGGHLGHRERRDI